MLVLVTYLLSWLAVVSSWILRSRQPHNDSMVSSGRSGCVRGRFKCIVLMINYAEKTRIPASVLKQDDDVGLKVLECRADILVTIQDPNVLER